MRTAIFAQQVMELRRDGGPELEKQESRLRAEEAERSWVSFGEFRDRLRLQQFDDHEAAVMASAMAVSGRRQNVTSKSSPPRCQRSVTCLIAK
ncbi:MAG: hypothetical protein ACRDHX_16560 [Chloroflexota bacterium]